MAGIRPFCESSKFWFRFFPGRQTLKPAINNEPEKFILPNKRPCKLFPA
jgi:hypothetical protein